MAGYPDATDARAARDKIRKRIAYAHPPGLSGGDVFDPCAFFEWAVGVRGWPSLASVEGLPRAPAAAAGQGGSTGRAVGLAVFVPENREALVEAFVAESVERHRLAARCEALEARLAQAETELADWRTKDALRRRRCGKRM
jgi:hypothetical protein